MDSQALTTRRGVRQLIGRLAALGRFISRSTNQLRPFFTTVRGPKWIGWNEECDQTFMAIKQYLAKPPILTSLRVGDTLYLYLAVSEVSVSATLFKEDKNQKQRSIFFIRKSLAEVETRYSRLEQATLALRVAAKKLRSYF